MGFSLARRDPPTRSGEEWKAKGTYAAAQAATQVKAAPSDTEKTHYIEGLVVSTAVAGYFQILSDGTEIIPPIYLAAGGGGQPQFLGVAIRCSKGKNIEVTTDIAGAHTILITGYTI